VIFNKILASKTSMAIMHTSCRLVVTTHKNM
jgi:hypothetical protein